MRDPNEELIDLNAGLEEDTADVRTRPVSPVLDRPSGERPTSGEPSLLRHREPTHNDRKNASAVGFLKGFGVGTLIGIPFALLILFSDAVIGWWYIVAWLVAGGIIGSRVEQSSLARESQDGFLRVDDSILDCRTRGPVVSVPLNRVFGAGPVKGLFGTELLRIYFLSNSNRGFDFKDRNLTRYEPYSGPAMVFNTLESSGNEIARQTIIRHINNRRKSGEPVAQLPPYNFQSVYAHKQNILFGDTIVEASFSCDGKMLRYTKGADTHEIPVHSVRDVQIKKVESKYGPTEWKVTLTMDPSTGQNDLMIDILRMSNPAEIDAYCRCLPALFPEPTKDGYWS